MRRDLAETPAERARFGSEGLEVSASWSWTLGFGSLGLWLRPVGLSSRAGGYKLGAWL